MKIFRQKKWELGWMIGNFHPTMLKSPHFEVCYKVHKKGEKYEVHTHHIATEYNYIIRGSMIIMGKKLYTGDAFIIEPYEIADPTFQKKTELIVVKIPSIPGDKYIIK